MNHPGKTLTGFKCWGEQLPREKGAQLTEKGKLGNRLQHFQPGFTFGGTAKATFC